MSYSRISKLIFNDYRFHFAAGFLLLCSAGLINLILKKPLIKLTKQDTAVNLNKNIFIFGSAGNKRLITDLIWIQTLLESDTEHYKKRDLNSWLFLRFNSIAALDPKFYENYLYGGQYLGIIKDDLDGANQLYKIGLKYFPDDYSLNYNAGFLNYYEIGNFQEGIKYLERIKKHPRAPLYIQSIINKLIFEVSGDKQEALKLLHENFNHTKDPTLKNRLYIDIYSLKADIDLNCLNAKKSNCERVDADGEPYISDKGSYRSKKPTAPYRLFRNQKQSE
jgi:tetratricopeptide (TPR) repeat protein